MNKKKNDNLLEDQYKTALGSVSADKQITLFEHSMK